MNTSELTMAPAAKMPAAQAKPTVYPWIAAAVTACRVSADPASACAVALIAIVDSSVVPSESPTY